MGIYLMIYIGYLDSYHHDYEDFCQRHYIYKMIECVDI